jgi:flagellar hook-associated protein 1 FlgK
VSTFSGLTAASSALFASQRAMDVTGQNIANVNTDGYSRQRVDLKSVSASAVPAVFSTSSGIGQGVDGDSVIRIRDAFMESRAQTEHATTASMTVRQTTLEQIEDAFHEPGDDGLQAQLSTMWSAWGDVTNNTTVANGGGARTAVLQTTQTVVANLHTISSTLDAQWSQNLDDLGVLVDDVNASASSIATLNQSIKQAGQAKLPTNELSDKRDALVLKIAQQTGATSTSEPDGTVTVNLGGVTLVSGSTTISLALAGGTDPAAGATDPPRLVTAPGGTTVKPGGTAEGELTAMNTTIPQYRTMLDGVAQQLVTQLNTAHQAGFDLAGAPGGPLLDNGTGTGTDAVVPSTVTAANIRLRISDPDELAAASLSKTAAGGIASGDSLNADRLAQLGSAAGSADSVYRKMIVGLGVQASVASGNLTAQNVISTQVDSARQSVSGVSIDEEMTNMLQFQHAYSAAARMITAMDETLDVLINRMGVS